MKEQEIRDILGKNIKKYRKQLKMSQEKLAEHIDIAPNFLSDIENGRKWISPNTLAKLTEALHINIGELFQMEETLPKEVTEILTKYAHEALAKVDKSLIDLRNYYSDTFSQKNHE
jgi:transcriptional regulator with XRE-family HTH domain